ncbi:transaldolase [Actinomyces sp. HMSC072A03]|nr:transaldolase [Actinomyces sp. HMSC072A03]
MSDNLSELSSIGVSVWLDDLSRQRIKSGNLQELIEGASVVGVTTNPAIFKAAIGDGKDYGDQVAQLAGEGASVEEAIETMTTQDVREACDLMLPVYKASGRRDGRVSIEVDPRLADKTEETIAAAKHLWQVGDRPNAMIKIPATSAGLAAIEEVIGAGISVNVTLIFSVPQYKQVIEAYWAGLEKAKQAGIDLSTVSSVASFFVSRVDTLVDKLLDAKEGKTARQLRSKAGVANARLAYETYQESLQSPRWQELARQGATEQRPLWASTGVKDPSLKPTLYVDELAADDTVNTMPEKTLRAVAASAELHGDAITPNLPEAHRVFDGLAEVGIGFSDVARQLLDEGVKKFEVAWEDLLSSVQKALEQA